MTRRVYGIILAGGIGTRLGLQIPKQFAKVAGKSLLEHTVGIFQRSRDIDEIRVMITPGWEDRAREALGDRYSKVTAILAGGETRNETTRIALDGLDDDAKIILHDAVRPMLDERIIRECVEGLDAYDALDVVIHSADTLVEVDDADVIVHIPDRSRFRRGQTPQAFRSSTLRRAYELASLDTGFQASDDCGVVLRYLPEVPIKTVVGAEHNIKVTHPVDLYIADRLFQLASRPSPTIDPRDLEGKVVVVFGASDGIGADVADAAEARGARVSRFSRRLSGTDIRNENHIRDALDRAVAEHGRVDAVVVAAGVLRTGALHEVQGQAVQELVEVNYLGPIIISRAAYPLLKETGGHLLFFTSSSYTRGRAGYSVYSSTKAAVVNLTQALAEEWIDDGIHVNVMNPERTATPMRVQAFGPEPVDTLLSPQEVARATLAVIASDATGMVFDVRLEALVIDAT